MSSYQAFDTHAVECDAWYDTVIGSTIFAMELDCLQPLLYRHNSPYLEIGVGSGRFAQHLVIGYGVDPAMTILRIDLPPKNGTSVNVRLEMREGDGERKGDKANAVGENNDQPK